MAATSEKIVVVGLRETIADLKKFDKEALKKFRKVLNTELKQLQNEAKAEVAAASTYGSGAPMSGWATQPPKFTRKSVRSGRGFPIWNAAEVANAITITRAPDKVRGDYTTTAFGLKNASAAGVIFETAGRRKGKSTVTSNAGSGEQFKRTLSARYGKARRLVYKVVLKHDKDVQRKLFDALEVAKSDLQKALEKRETKMAA